MERGGKRKNCGKGDHMIRQKKIERTISPGLKYTTLRRVCQRNEVVCLTTGRLNFVGQGGVKPWGGEFSVLNEKKWETLVHHVAGGISCTGVPHKKKAKAQSKKKTSFEKKNTLVNERLVGGNFSNEFERGVFLAFLSGYVHPGQKRGGTREGVEGVHEVLEGGICGVSCWKGGWGGSGSFT